MVSVKVKKWQHQSFEGVFCTTIIYKNVAVTNLFNSLSSNPLSAVPYNKKSFTE